MTVTRGEFIAGKQRAVERLASVDRADRVALFAALLVVRAHQRIPEMLRGWDE